MGDAVTNSQTGTMPSLLAPEGGPINCCKTLSVYLPCFCRRIQASRRAANPAYLSAFGRFLPVATLSYVAWAGDQLSLRTVWSEDVKSSPGYDYRPLIFEASFDTTLLGAPR
jgi:hypothetical protein